MKQLKLKFAAFFFSLSSCVKDKIGVDIQRSVYICQDYYSVVTDCMDQ